MASSSFSVKTPGIPIDTSTHQTRSTTHHGHGHGAKVYPPPPGTGSGQKRSYRGSASTSVYSAPPDQEPRQFDPGDTGRDSPPAKTPRPQVKQDDGPDSPNVDTPPDSTDAGPSAKKRKTGRGSRGVANLTPEQLERKRANDREAQRAIRERQRLRTEELERKIAELKSTEPYQELQKALHQKAAVEAELADVKRSLTAVMAIIQPIIGGVANANRPFPSPTHSLPVTQPPMASATHNTASTPMSATSPVSHGAHAQWQNSLSPVAATASVDGQQPQPSSEMSMLHQQRYDLVHGLELGSDRLGLDFLVDPSLKVARIQSGANGAQDSPQYRHVPMKHATKQDGNWPATISMLPGMPGTAQTQPQTQSPIYPQSPLTSGVPSTSTTTTAATAGPTTTTTPIYALLPRNCPPTCPLDSLLLDFLSERRQRAAEGLSQTEILGPRYPSVSSLLNPEASVYSHPLSKVFTDILARFPDLATLPERVAVLYVMFLHMRWQVSPTQENYLRLPTWFRPVRCQTEKEHPAWFDHLPFPRMREKLVDDYEPGGFPFDNFFIPFTSTLSLNWPYQDAYVLLASPTGDELMINPVFEQHIGVLGNWTLGERFARAFPGLEGCFNLRRE